MSYLTRITKIITGLPIEIYGIDLLFLALSYFHFSFKLHLYNVPLNSQHWIGKQRQLCMLIKANLMNADGQANIY